MTNTDLRFLRTACSALSALAPHATRRASEIAEDASDDAAYGEEGATKLGMEDLYELAIGLGLVPWAGPGRAWGDDAQAYLDDPASAC